MGNACIGVQPACSTSSCAWRRVFEPRRFCRKLGDFLRQLLHVSRPIVAPAREQTHILAVDAGEDAITV
jgi:hypothetical protein